MKKEYHSNETKKTKEEFDRVFAYNAGMRELEENQLAFSSVFSSNPDLGEIIICSN